MGQLPAARVTPTRVFNRVGVDFCGPFEIKNFTGRSKQLGRFQFRLHQVKVNLSVCVIWEVLLFVLSPFFAGGVDEVLVGGSGFSFPLEFFEYFLLCFPQFYISCKTSQDGDGVVKFPLASQPKI
ncbi:hypothetical protein CEXT_285931 [Caerostris extrusa]|uniref:Uncharacterized protein n=1 Tax=Caerostris extrusa TaxID=172846 RepID=A0AAV4SQS4_CAEEX|nr:hypothetical protein CEXT_285931 [Caerostris extrusa]